MPPARRLRANRRLEGRPCARCGAPLGFGDETVVCGVCETPHHAACFDARPGCHACARSAPPPPPPSPPGFVDPFPEASAGTAPGAWASLVFALIGLFPIVFSVAFVIGAFIRAREARRALAMNPGLRGASLAVAGTVIGAVALVEWLILVGLKIWAMI